MASLFDRFPGSRSLNGYAGDKPSVNRMAVAQGRGTRPASSGKAEKLNSLSDKSRDPFNKKKKEDLDKKDSVKVKSSAENDSSGKFKSADGKSKPGDGKSKTTEDSKSKSPSESKNSKSGEGKAKADSGYKNRDTLQAQTVQFSSGDGAGGAAMGALSGLMSLLAASQTLASAMNASTNVVAQNATLTLRTNFQTPASSSGGFASHQIKSGVIGTEAKLEMPLTFKDINFSLSSSQSQSNSSGLSASLGGSKGIFERGNSISVNEEKQSSSPTVVYIGSPTLLTVNSATFFFDSTVQFAFPKGEFPGQVNSYFKSANLPTSSSYSYAIVQADGSTVPAKLDSATGNFLVNEFSISPQGDINTTNVTRPVTELIRITGQDATLDVRVSAGPGSTNMNPPTINPGKVIINNSKDIITGNRYALDINSDFLGGSHPNVLISNTNFTLDSNLIFRHLIGTASSPDAPFDASGIATSVGANRSFGNFSNLTINLNDVVQQLPPPQPLTYTIKFGGNVLDTYGLSYGDGGTFDLTLPQADVGVNAIMGGNTLAGFGGFVGDLISFVLHPTPNIKIDPQVPNAFTFNANSLFVDKAIGTTLYPHLVILDLRSPESPYTNQLANNHFNFSDSIMRGNIGNDTFFGDVQNLGTINNYAILGSNYTGFLTGVTVTNTDNHVVITDKNSNTITWGNNVYTGGLGKDTYSFTIVGDYHPDKPPMAVMQGNATIRDFNVSQDKLQFVLTPAVFRALDTNVDRILSLDELNAGVTFSSGDLVDPLTKQSAAGTTISFSGGGTLNLGNVSISTFQAITGGVTAGFSGGLDSLGTYNYVATSAIDPASLTQPAIYGSQPATHIYALDAFFNNSDLNLYTVQTSAGMTLPAGIIDVFGSITPTNRDAFLGSVTITATDLSNHTDTNTILMGFVDAAETTTVADGATAVGAKGLLSDIMYGGAGSTLVGDAINLGIQPSGGALQGTTNEYGGNIIIDTAGVKNAYGSAVTVSFVNEGVSGTDSGAQKTDGNTFTFHGNAFYTKALDAKTAIYGTTQTLTISAKGSDSTVLTQQSPAAVDNSGHFDNNHVNFGPQTIYSNGIIYGNMETFNLNVQTGNTVEEQHMSGNGFYSGVVDISGSIQGNTFTFAPNHIMIQGDTASSDSSTVYANLKSLLITIQQTVPPANNPNMTVTASSTFKDNTFVFGDSVLDASKNAGMFTSFYGHITDFGSLSNPKDYHGFIDGNIEVKTVGVGADAHLVTTDVNNNAIIWGNNTYTGGAGTDIYNFRLLADDNQVVFTGFDTIKNLNVIPLGGDILSFKVDDTLFRLLDTSGNGSISAAEMDAIATFTYGGYGTIIHFDGGGSLFLENIYANTFSKLPFVIDALPTVNASAVFNPVFITGSRSGIFDDFINNIDPSQLTYTAVGLPSGMTLATDGALKTTVSGIVDAAITVTASNQNVSLVLPTFHVFALNTTNDIITSASTDTVSGSKDAQAFNVKGSIVYGGENSPLTLENANVLYGSKLINNMGTTPHTIYGDVSSIKNDTTSNIAGKTFTFDHNLLNIKGDDPVNSDNLIPDQIYGNVGIVSISTPVDIHDNFLDNTFNFLGNTIYGTGNVYGNMRTLTFDGTSGSGDISSNTFYFGANHLTEGAYLNGFNTLTDNNGATTLYAGIGSLKLPDSSNIYNNHLVYGDSGLISHGTGITNFYGDIGDLTSTTFYTQMVTATSFSNHVNVVDIHGNDITWGNVTMNGSSVGTDIFNFNLLLSNTHDIVMQGNASINNFTMGQDMLTLHLSDALYNSLQLANPTASYITASMLDTFHNNSFNLGSITLNGNQVTTLADLGTNVAVKADITPTDGISNPETIIQGTANADTFHINASGNSIDSFKELSHLIDFSSGPGSVSDTLQLNFSDALFKSLGLSDSNSSAQNFDHLVNAAHTATGGIAMTTTATDTILTFTSSAGNYGSITLHNVALDPVINPIQNHLLITHS